jgi:Tol biopolymer transport system component
MSTWIAFTDLHLELCLLNTTTREERRFFPGMGVEYYTWSPDGRYLAFSAQSSPSTNGLYTLFLFEIESETLQQVAQTKGRMIWSWSPDGRKLAFLDKQYGDESWLIEVEHGTRERLAAESAFAIWSRENGKLVGLWLDHDEGGTIHVMEPDGRYHRLLTPGEHMIFPRHGHNWAAPPVNWSPSGQFFASHLCHRMEQFDSQGQLVSRQVDLHLQVVDKEGHVLFERPWEAHLYRWSPDSRHLACLATKTEVEGKNGPKVGEQYVCVLPWDGSALHILGTTKFWPHHQIAWSPDGQYLAFAGYPEGQRRGDGQCILWIGRADGQEVRALTEPRELGAGEMTNPPKPTWSPDGTRIAFVDTGSLWVVGLHEGPPHLFPGTEKLSESFIMGEIAWQP